MNRPPFKMNKPSLAIWDAIGFPCSDGGETTVLLPDINKLLHWALNNIPEWQCVLRGHASGDDPVVSLQPIIYYDEVTCGNILAVHKRKKIMAMYLLSF